MKNSKHYQLISYISGVVVFVILTIDRIVTGDLVKESNEDIWLTSTELVILLILIIGVNRMLFKYLFRPVER